MNDDKLADGPLPVGEIPEWLRLLADSLDDNRHMRRPLVESEDTTFYIRQSADRIEDLQALVKALQRENEALRKDIDAARVDTP